MKNNIMLDIETMDSASTAAIVSIGAVQFDMETAETGKQFYANIDLQSCIDAGLTVSASTIMWWMSKDKEAQNSLIDNPISLFTALNSFNEWLYEINGENCEIWANSPSFDCVILKNAFNAIKVQPEWRYYNERCVRTLTAFNPGIRKQIINDLPHDALNDCLYQIKYCSAIWNTIRKYSAIESGLLERFK